MLTVGLSCTLLFSSTTIDHAVTQQRHAGLDGQLAITSTGPGKGLFSARNHREREEHGTHGRTR